METPRTPFATEAEPAPRSAQIIQFPGHAIAWAHPPTDHIAIVNSRGEVRRFRHEGALHADVLDRHRGLTAQVERRERRAEAAAFDSAPALARLPYLIAGVPRQQLAMLAGLGAVIAAGAIAFLIMAHSLSVLAELAR